MSETVGPRTMLDSEYDADLVSDFTSRFLGYGSLESKIWLIGPEPGGGATIGDVYTRVVVWSERGRPETDELHSYHDDLKKALAQMRLPANFDWRRNHQPTWGPLIRVVLGLQDPVGEISTEAVKEYQRAKLGSVDGECCALDLLPFSSPSQSDWKLAEFELPWLKTREEYKSHLAERRCGLMRSKLLHHRPMLVLFYGDRVEQKRWWETISQHTFSRSQAVAQLLLARDENTLFATVPHPVNLNTRLTEKGVGAVNRFWASVAAALRKELLRR
jgi:hypothetical protein